MKTLTMILTGVAVGLAQPAFAQTSPSPGSSAGTSVGPATGRPDTPPEPPAAKVQQPSKEGQQPQSGRMNMGSTTGQQSPSGAGAMPSAKMTQDTDKNGQGSAQRSTDAAQSVTSSHELKEILRRQGFANVKILAESFVVQGEKDGKVITMVLGPNGLSAFEVSGASPGEDTVTGSVLPGGSQSTGQMPKQP
jgi:hypothetical protein